MPDRDLKGLMIILDGLGDCPIAELDGLTPLEAARTPNLDRLAARGICGVVDPISPDVTVGTQVGAGVLLGFDPEQVQRLGRGVVEAAGISLALEPGDVAFRCNFATLTERDGELHILDRRAGRIMDGTEELSRSIDDMPLGENVRATVRPATHHRAVVRLSGAGLSDEVEDTDPGDAVALPAPVNSCKPKRRSDAPSGRTARALNQLIKNAFTRLDEHPVNARRRSQGLPPANGIITRGAGRSMPVAGRLAARGLSAAVVAAECTLIGLARLLGYSVVTDPRFTALVDTDLDAKLTAAMAALEEHDIVFLHIKATDVCAHDRQPLAKRDFIERVDVALAPLLDAADIVVAISADHSTDSNTGSHTGNPVPSLVSAPGVEADECRAFNETACPTGRLGRGPAVEFLDTFLDCVRPAGAATENIPLRHVAEGD